MAIRYFTSWTKYPGYKLKTHKEKGRYVMPLGGELMTYDPFACGDELLLALLSIGFAPAEERVLDFCNRFGLLGFGQAVIQKEYESSIVKLHPGNVLGRKAFHETELMDLLFPFDDHSHRVKKGDEMCMTDRWEEKFSDKPWPLFSPEYAEQVEWIACYAKQLYDMLLQTYRGEPFEYALGNAKMGLLFDGQAETVWRFDSLKTAVDILFIDLLQKQKPSVRLCLHCHKPFLVPVGTRASYCSVSCRNVENVRRSRQRKKETEHRT